MNRKIGISHEPSDLDWTFDNIFSCISFYKTHYGGDKVGNYLSGLNMIHHIQESLQYVGAIASTNVSREKLKTASKAYREIMTERSDYIRNVRTANFEHGAA